MSEFIFVEQEPMAGKEHAPQPGTTIGREGCDINVPDPEMSRRHAAIRQVDSGVGIEDLGSTNGTFVNGERINGLRALKEGDVVQFGNTAWKLQAATSATAVADVPAAPAPPQVTAARQVPADAPPPQPAAPPAPRPPAPAPPTPAGAPAAAAAPAAAQGGQRGDVPRPDFAPSAIRRVVPPPGAPAAFNPADPGRNRGSAATRVEATVAAYVATALVAAGVVAYYITKPFE